MSPRCKIPALFSRRLRLELTEQLEIRCLSPDDQSKARGGLLKQPHATLERKTEFVTGWDSDIFLGDQLLLRIMDISLRRSKARNISVSNSEE